MTPTTTTPFVDHNIPSLFARESPASPQNDDHLCAVCCAKAPSIEQAAQLIRQRVNEALYEAGASRQRMEDQLEHDARSAKATAAGFHDLYEKQVSKLAEVTEAVKRCAGNEELLAILKG